MLDKRYEITWTIEKIREGFKRFFEENKRYPTTIDIDKCNYLPSSRQIQRRWKGGVRQLRQELNLTETDFTKGKLRSDTATYIGSRGINKEREIQKILIDRFGEICVHEQKPFNNYSGRFDFVVYGKNKKFAVDVFFPIHKNSLTGCINSKQRLYKEINFDVILLQANPEIQQEQLDSLAISKENQLSKNIILLSIENFLKYIEKIEPYTSFS